MIFTPQDIQEIFSVVDYRVAIVVADVLGKDFLTKEDEEVLKANGFDLEKEIQRIPLFWQAYLFGRLSSLLTPRQLLTLGYTDIKKYIERNQYKEPTRREIAEYKAAATNTYLYIKGMGNKVKETLSNSISKEELLISVKEREEEVRRGIKEGIERGILERKAVQSIVSDLGHKLDEWNRDWGRIVETEMQNVYLVGKAQVIMDDHGVDAKVYKQVFAGACKHCIKFYTQGGIGTEPRAFKLKDLIANGTNIGLKQKDWRPTLGPVHPFCYDDKTEVFTDQGWKLFKDLKGDELFWSLNVDSEGKCNIDIQRTGVWVKAVDTFSVWYEGEMFEWKDKDFSLRVTPNHNHVTTRDFSATVQIKKLQDIDWHKEGFLSSAEKGYIAIFPIDQLGFYRSHYEGFVYDVTLETNHILLVRRNGGRSVVSGNCRCELRYIPEGYVWDDELKSYVPPKDYKPKVKRRSKVTITVGDKEFKV